MSFRLNTKCGIKEEIQEFDLLNAKPVNIPTKNEKPIGISDTGVEKKIPKCANAKIPAVINTLFLGVTNFLMYC